VADKKLNIDRTEQLRRKAEKIARGKADPAPVIKGEISLEEIQKTLHELQIHQIELEMQNEELRQAQKDLEDSRERYFSLYDLAPVGYLTLNVQGLIMEANLTASTLLGAERSSLVRQLLSGFILKEDQDSYYLHRRELIESRQPQTCELRMKKKDGNPFWARLEATAGQENNTSPICRVMIIDITKRKQTEELLRESEEIFSQFMAHSPVLVYIKDEKLRFLKMSSSFEGMFGQPINELLGKDLFELIPPELAVSVNADDMSVLQKKVVVNAEEILNHKIYSTVKFPIQREAGKPDYLGGISVDITERKKLEEEVNGLYQKEKHLRQHLEEEAKTRIQFIDVLAHELKGPLTPILASSGMLGELLTNSSDPNLKKLADNIYSGANILINRLEELLEVARFARGAVNLNLQPTVLSLFIEQVVSRYTPSITQRKQQIACDLPQDLPAVSLDRSRVEQVIINLLSNASKYSPERSCIRLSAAKQDHKVSISVKDEGVGISPEEQVRLFHPYQRVGKDQHNVQGLGLGLTVVKYIVEAHGGRVRVTSKPGKGSTFSFTIPITGKSEHQMFVP
jgi:PAS domain S-box-containing protein